MLMPLARQQGLKVQEVADEVLVYDLERHRAHCLNKTAALVWRQCDGKTNLEETVGILQQAVQTPVDEDVVRIALDRLRRAHLLSMEGSDLPETIPSRRVGVRRLGKLGLLALPVVSSIVAPTPAHALTCVSEASCPTMPNCTPCHKGRTKGKSSQHCNRMCCLDRGKKKKGRGVRKCVKIHQARRKCHCSSRSR